jgi:tRNA U34 5-methylaminomethyl-2-thiouridine-forming methyltransferase MnmC
VLDLAGGVFCAYEAAVVAADFIALHSRSARRPVTVEHAVVVGLRRELEDSGQRGQARRRQARQRRLTLEGVSWSWNS